MWQENGGFFKAFIFRYINVYPAYFLRLQSKFRGQKTYPKYNKYSL